MVVNSEELVLRYADTDKLVLHELFEEPQPGRLARRFADALPGLVTKILSTITASEALWCSRYTVMPVFHYSMGTGSRSDSLASYVNQQLFTRIQEPGERPWFEGYHQRKLESELLLRYGFAPAPEVLMELEAVEAEYGSTSELELSAGEREALMLDVVEALDIMSSAHIVNPHGPSATMLSEALRHCRSTEVVYNYSRLLSGFSGLYQTVDRARLKLVKSEADELSSFDYLTKRTYSSQDQHLVTDYSFIRRLTQVRWESMRLKSHDDYSRELDAALEQLPQSVARSLKAYELKEARYAREERREQKREAKEARKQAKRERREQKRAEKRGEPPVTPGGEPELIDHGDGSYEYRGNFEPGAMTLDMNDPLVKLMMSGAVYGERTDQGWRVQTTSIDPKANDKDS